MVIRTKYTIKCIYTIKHFTFFNVLQIQVLETCNLNETNFPLLSSLREKATVGCRCFGPTENPNRSLSNRSF